MSTVEFQGFDWTELYEPLVGKPYPDDVGIEEEKGFADEIREKMSSAVFCCSKDQEVEQARIANICRDFLRVMVESDGYEKPLIEGLIAIEHDTVFLRYMDVLLEYLWT